MTNFRPAKETWLTDRLEDPKEFIRSFQKDFRVMLTMSHRFLHGSQDGRSTSEKGQKSSGQRRGLSIRTSGSSEGYSTQRRRRRGWRDERPWPRQSIRPKRTSTNTASWDTASNGNTQEPQTSPSKTVGARHVPAKGFDLCALKVHSVGHPKDGGTERDHQQACWGAQL